MRKEKVRILLSKNRITIHLTVNCSMLVAYSESLVVSVALYVLIDTGFIS